MKHEVSSAPVWKSEPELAYLRTPVAFASGATKEFGDLTMGELIVVAKAADMTPSEFYTDVVRAEGEHERE